MTKEQYLKELNVQLRHLPKEDREHAIEYYTEYLEETGEGIDQAIEEIGTPKEVSEQIITELAYKIVDEKGQKDSKRNSNLRILILALFVAPISIPVLIMSGILVISVIFMIILFLFSFVVFGFLLIAVGLGGSIISVIALFQNLFDAMAIGGISMISIGVGIFVTYGGLILWDIFKRKLCQFYKNIINLKRNKRIGKEELNI